LRRGLRLQEGNGDGMSDQPSRRIYRIPEAMILEMLRGKLSLPVPEDVKIAGFWRDCSVDRNYFHENDVVLCVSLEHESFDPVTWKVPFVEVIEKKPNRIETAKPKTAVRSGR